MSLIRGNGNSGGRHNKIVAVDDSIYDFINLRYRDDIERYRRGKTVSE